MRHYARQAMKTSIIPKWRQGLLLLLAGGLVTCLWVCTHPGIWSPVHATYLYHTNVFSGQRVAVVKLENPGGSSVSFSIQSEQLVGGHWQSIPSVPQGLNVPVAGYSGLLEPHCSRLLLVAAPEKGERFFLKCFSDPTGFELDLQAFLWRLRRFGFYKPFGRRVTTAYVYPKT